jgi:putative ABC transport system substrate-binding protein
MSTPVISASCGIVRKKPVVFTYCSDPVAAGAGKSFTDHLSNVTGVGSFPPVEEMVDFIHTVMPKATTIGTIYNASEANSVKVIEVARGLFEKAGMKLDEITVSSSADVLQAAQALAGRHVDALYIQGDNTVLQGFEAVVKAARDARIPVFVDDPEVAKQGAIACVGLGYYKPGYASAKTVARVLLGESPAKIPMENVSDKVLWLNLPEAEKIGFTFPKKILDEFSVGSVSSGTNTPKATRN